MTDIDIARVAELVSQGKSDHAIAVTFQVSRHHARKLIEQAKIELVRQEQRGDVGSAEVIAVDPEPETVEEFVQAINNCLRKSVEGIREAGRHLISAKAKHPREWTRMVDQELDMTPRTAQRLMAIARDERFATHGSHLPTTWRTLAELTQLDDEQFSEAIDSGAIHPGMSRQEAVRLKNPAAPSPDGEAHLASAAASPSPRVQAVAASAPPHLESGIGKQESESEVMPSGGVPKAGERPLDQPASILRSDTPPRPAVSEPGGAEESDRAESDAPTSAIVETTPELEGAAVAQQLRDTYGKEKEPAPSLPNGHRAIAPSRNESSDSLDFFPTPPWATRALMEHVLPRLGIRHADSTRISYCWEPACGEGHMAEVLREYIYHVTATDIRDYGYASELDGRKRDFLDENTIVDPPFGDWIITNPPFGETTLAFLTHALELAQTGIAFFTRTQWACEGIGKYEKVYHDRPPTLFAPFTERVPIHKGRWEPDGATLTSYCWLVWVKNMAPKPAFWIPPGCREALTKPDDAERFTVHPVTRKEHVLVASVHDAPREQITRSGEMPDMPAILDRRKEHTESN